MLNIVNLILLFLFSIFYITITLFAKERILNKKKYSASVWFLFSSWLSFSIAELAVGLGGFSMNLQPVQFHQLIFSFMQFTLYLTLAISVLLCIESFLEPEDKAKATK